MQIVGLNDIQALVSHTTTLAAIEAALRQLDAGQVSAPAEIAFLCSPSGEVHVKGAHLHGSRWIVVKLASGGFEGAPNAGASLLIDATTGAPRAVLDDGGWLTEMRTAAAGVLATNLMGPAGPLRVAVLGTGVQARYQLEALRAARDVREVAVWGRTHAAAEAYASETGARLCPTVEAAVETADVIITATSATSPILMDDQVRPGTHITAIGADTVGKHELDPAILSDASLVAADDLTTCVHAGELQHAPAVVSRAVPLASLAAAGPTDRDRRAITVADLCGIGTYDAAIANLVAEQLNLV